MTKPFMIGCCAAILMSSVINLLAIRVATEVAPSNNSIIRDQNARMLVIQEHLLDEVREQTGILSVLQQPQGEN